MGKKKLTDVEKLAKDLASTKKAEKLFSELFPIRSVIIGSTLTIRKPKRYAL